MNTVALIHSLTEMFATFSIHSVGKHKILGILS